MEFKEEIEDEQVIWGVWRSRWSSRKEEEDEQEILGLL